MLSNFPIPKLGWSLLQVASAEFIQLPLWAGLIVLRCSSLQVASAVFIQPPLATVGLTEEEAREQISGEVDVFVSKFRPMKNTITGGTVKTLVKQIVEVSTQKV